MGIITINNLTKRYDNSIVLDNISLDIEENKIYGLLGRNGSGKTTLLNMITNRVFQDSGEITIDRESNIENDNGLEKVFYTTQGNFYPEKMKVKELFQSVALFYRNFDMDYAYNLSKRFELNINKKIKSLSTGYKSIVNIVVALSSNAKVLIFDEPILGLDAVHRDIFYRELVKEYIEKPKTIIISTHIIEEIADIVEHIVIINDHKVIIDDDVENIKNLFYSVSGRESDINELIENRECISCESIGGFKMATIKGKLSISDKDTLLEKGLEVNGVDIQKLFINLTNREERL